MTGITTSPVNPGTPTTTPMVIEVNVGDIMEQAKRLSLAVNEVGENNMRHMGAVSLAVDVVGSEYYDHLHEMTTISLQQIQASLRVIHQQMTAYTSTMGPNATEFHRVKADVAAAIELADLYLSPTPIPQLIFHPTDTQQGDVTPSNDTLDAPTRPSTLVQRNTTSSATTAIPLTNETTDNSSGMQVDNEPIDEFLQLSLRQDEREHIDRLLEEPMEQLVDTPAPNHDPRDGSYALAPGPILPLLGPGDVEVTVETSVGPETPAEEIVDNKTVRVDDEDLPPETPGTQIICQGCKRVGHVADSCPLTGCQQWKLEK